jgi:hypothetical protein
MNVGYGALTRSGRPSHAVPLPMTFVTSRAPARSSRRFLQPPAGNGVHLDTGLSLGSSPFARRYLGNHYCFLFLQVLRWFSSLGVALHAYGLSMQ